MKAMIARVLCALILVNSLPMTANAAIVSTQEASMSERAAIMNIIKREDVRAEFANYGITAQEMEVKLASMSDSEIRYMHDQLETMPAGQSAVGAVVGAAVLVFIILLVTDLLGLTNVFDFVRR